jgi:precorrin-2 dehydrogenase/sirohydrochlorin ferrochelatase
MALYYPIYLNITAKRCVVIGGGAVAERKVMGLLRAGASVHVVSPAITDPLQELARAGKIEYVSQEYSPDHLDDCELVFAATSSRAVNARVTADAIARRVHVNVADAPQEGDFITPAVVRRGEFCLSVATGGSNPALAARLAGEMEARFGPEYGDFVELLGEVRDTIKEWTLDLTARRQAAEAVLDHESELCALLAEGHREDAANLASSLALGAIDHPVPGAYDPL